MAAERNVRVVYLVPADRMERQEFTMATTAAISHVQRWFWERMGNRKSFRLHAPVVEVAHLPHDASWYVSHKVAAPRSQWFWQNVLADGFAAMGAGFHDDRNRWVFYIDAENEPDQAVGGNAGVALLPRHDLMGLIGQTMFPAEPEVCRWVGGLGHELGHAFELPHPPGYETPALGRSAASLMAYGFRAYPETFLNPEDIARLDASPFFSPMAFAEPLRDCADLLAVS
jgi:hypothetical protein